MNGSSGPKVVVDDKSWPIVIVTQAVAQLTDQERADSLDRSNRVLESHGTDRYAMVLDNRLAGPPPPVQRRMMAEYMERYAPRMRARCVCTAFVFSSSLMRSILTAVIWLRRPAVQTEVFSSLDEAVAWARAKLQADRAQKTGTERALDA